MEKKQITVTGVLEDLENGQTREQIREKHGLTVRELKLLFAHPKLKGKKTKVKYEPTFELVDDTDETVSEPEAVEEPQEDLFTS